MRDKRISEHRIISFDCYGTLIDWESGIVEGLSGLAHRCLKAPEPDIVLESFARHEAAVEREFPGMLYSGVLKEVFRRTADEWKVGFSSGEVDEFGNAAGEWKPFPDTVEALAYLKKHFRLVILSNVDHANFSRTAEKLAVEFDHVFLAEDIGSYKPSIRNFEHMLETLNAEGFARQEVLHTAESLFHDHAPANDVGLSSCWIHRRAGKEGSGATSVPVSMPHYDFRFESLAEMVEAHRNEML